jgi:hypothetical protein
LKGKRQKVSTLKALANTLAISEASTITVSIFLFVLRVRTLLDPPFLLRVDRGKLSEERLILGRCMTEEIGGAL